MDIASINSETVHMHYSVDQFKEQEGPKRVRNNDMIKTLLCTQEGYDKIRWNNQGNPSIQQKFPIKISSRLMEMWKVRWQIRKARSEIVSNQHRKKFKHYKAITACL